MMPKKYVVETMVLLVIASLFLAGFYYQNQESKPGISSSRRNSARTPLKKRGGNKTIYFKN